MPAVRISIACTAILLIDFGKFDSVAIESISLISFIKGVSKVLCIPNELRSLSHNPEAVSFNTFSCSLLKEVLSGKNIFVCVSAGVNKVILLPSLHCEIMFVDKTSFSKEFFLSNSKSSCCSIKADTSTPMCVP